MKDAELLISVVMPNYNKGAFAAAAVASVMEQDYPFFELIFVDDASTDGSALEVEIRAHSDSRLQVVRLPQRIGGGAARNAGLARAKGGHVLFMDSDDWMAPGALGRAAHALDEGGPLDFVVFPMGFFDRMPGDTDRTTPPPNEQPDLLRFFRRDHPWLISGPVWKRSFLGAVGGFDASLTSQQDFDFHVRALMESPTYRFVKAPPLVLYRQEVESEARLTSQSLPSIQARAAMLERHLGGLAEKGLRTAQIDRAIAVYLLDLAQKMRWHKAALGERSTQEGLRIWLVAYGHGLVSPGEYNRGMGYIRFKHQMLWNRLPSLQQRLENRYRRQLGDLLPPPDLPNENTK